MSDKIFYKFKNLKDYTFDSLKEKYFYFSTPEKLNDPEDCRIPLCYEANNKEILRYIKHMQKLSKEKMYLAYPFNTVDKIKNHINTNTKNNMFKETLYKSINDFHLLSLTDSFEYINMWNHNDYCNRFKGICIGYHAYQLPESKENSFSIEVNDLLSCGRKYIQSNSKYYLPLIEIEYDNDRKHYYNPFKENYDREVIQNPENTDNIKYNLFHKTSEWQNEHEYRSFYFNHDTSKVFYPDSTLESITFGCNVTSEDQSKIKQIVKKNYCNYDSIKFYVMSVDNSKVIRKLV